MNPGELTRIVVGTCWFSLVIGVVLRGRHRGNREKKGVPAAYGGFLLEGVACFLVWFVRRNPESPFLPLPFAGDMIVDGLLICIGVLSAALIIDAMRRLGKQWSPSARLIEGHELITSGSYRIVRHPIYSGMLGLLVATGGAFSTPWILLIAIVVYVAGTLIRTRIEERLLVEHFGAAYEEYRSRVPALVPFLK
jgi:protein-S-isoprenylcysteine O-methyltransferase Ste14